MLQAAHAPSRTNDDEAEVVNSFDNAIPAFVEAELDRLYGNPYSSLPQMRIYGGLTDDICTYVVMRGDAVVQVLLYRISGDRVKVLNEGLKLGSEEIARFTRYVFATYLFVNVIVFHAIETNTSPETWTSRFPLRRHNCLEDIAMKLPNSIEAYRASLGKNTRRNLKRYMDRLLNVFPTFRFDVYEGQALKEEHVRAIIACNRLRMASKKKTSDFDEAETRRIVRMAQTCGMVGVATIDGRVCGGTVSYRAGDNYFLYILAHNPQYDGYWIGILTCYLTISECIRRGGKEFHFLWGRYDYKFTLGAKLRNLDHITIYRSPQHMLRNAKTFVGDAYRDAKRRAQIWLRYEFIEKNRIGSALYKHVWRNVAT
jgi:hypothetical protein